MAVNYIHFELFNKTNTGLSLTVAKRIPGTTSSTSRSTGYFIIRLHLEQNMQPATLAQIKKTLSYYLDTIQYEVVLIRAVVLV